MPSPDAPLTGRCACGAVRFEVTAPFETAGYCHCLRCQHRSGGLWSTNAFVRPDGFRVTQGAGKVRTWTPEGGSPKSFCEDCGGHVFGGRDEGPYRVVRFGALEGDPGIEPQWHAWLESAPDWAPVPEDGLERFDRGASLRRP
jgi:hypothetical protein